MKESEILVYCRRGGLIESKHRGHIAVTDDDGRLIYYVGDPMSEVFIRSTAKPFQAIPLIESGGESAFGLADEEISVICASHSGEAFHQAAVTSILNKIGCSEDQLICRLEDMCSGKHAGMLALAVLSNETPNGYWLANHPIQQKIQQAVATICGISIDSLSIAYDGCGVPVFGMQLHQLASGYARMSLPNQISCIRILDAVRNKPIFLAGTERFDTALLIATNGRLFGKMGAEGVYAITAPEAGIGAAIKVEDGSERALYPTVIELLMMLKLLSAEEETALKSYRVPVIYSRNGIRVGDLKPSFNLLQP